MEADQKAYFSDLVTTQENLTRDGIHYWTMYSHFGTWQFWVILGMLLIPLIFVYLFIDRRRIFQIAFFGFAAHVLFAYTDAFGIRYGLWGYPYQVLPFLPSISLDASIIPVAIMLVYQWTVNKQHNFYLYAVGMAVVFGFGFKPLLTSLELFVRYDWVNYFVIFMIYLVLYILAYWLTNFFLYLQKKNRPA